MVEAAERGVLLSKFGNAGLWGLIVGSSDELSHVFGFYTWYMLFALAATLLDSPCPAWRCDVRHHPAPGSLWTHRIPAVGVPFLHIDNAAAACKSNALPITGLICGRWGRHSGGMADLYHRIHGSAGNFRLESPWIY